jgi:hypothetical protein
MNTSRRAASGNAFSKIAFSLGAVLLVFAPPTARPGGAQEFYDFHQTAVTTASPGTFQSSQNDPNVSSDRRRYVPCFERA